MSSSRFDVSMRIGINCLNLDGSFAGGLTTFARGLLDGFASVAHEYEFRVYVTSGNQQLFDSLSDRKNFEIVKLDEPTILRKKNLCRASLILGSENIYRLTSNWIFRDIRRLMDRDNDIVYTPSVVLQSFNNRTSTVLSMHDIQHVHYPQFFGWHRKLSRRVSYGLSARHANYFQASSEFIKQDLLRHFNCISAEQIAVIPEGVNIKEFTQQMDTTDLCSRYNIPERFLLFPAQLWPHKNHITILQVLKDIAAKLNTRIPLVLTGGKYSAAPELFEYMARESMDYVYYLGKVPFADLVGLYQKAAFLIMPSLHESSSLPILEAAASGTPVIASRIPPNEELAKVLQLNLFDPLDSEELAKLLVSLWNDQPAAAAQAASNRKHIVQYSWENSARKFLRLFENILSSRGLSSE